ncbi:MAG: DUF1576 domain-containing protein [Clostridium sp.]
MNLRSKFSNPYLVFTIIYLFMIIVAFFLDSPYEILNGLKNIILTPDILITDYIEIGGVGATLVNAALTSLICTFILIKLKIKANGSTIIALWLMTGFSFFGKNLLNIWPIMIGVALFARYQKQPLLNYSLVMMLSTTLAPTSSQLSFVSDNIFISLACGSVLGIFIGFILSPIATHCISAHGGFNLYNIGFASGLLATLVMSAFRSFGINFEARLIWDRDNSLILSILLIIICIYLIIIGFYIGNNNINNLKSLVKHPGRLVSDFYILYGGTAYINMGLVGIFSTLYILVLGADINGPIIAGIMTIMGFGAFGKHLKNIIPVMLGATLAAIIYPEPVYSPSLSLAILFSTCLAPISGKFGYKIGILSGILHVFLVMNVGYLHGGLNLYNNGLAGGLVAMILIPLITTFKKDVKKDEV